MRSSFGSYDCLDEVSASSARNSRLGSTSHPNSSVAHLRESMLFRQVDTYPSCSRYYLYRSSSCRMISINGSHNPGLGLLRFRCWRCSCLALTTHERGKGSNRNNTNSELSYSHDTVVHHHWRVLAYSPTVI